MVGLLHSGPTCQPGRGPNCPARPGSQSWPIIGLGLGYHDWDGAFSIEYDHHIGQDGRLETDSVKKQLVLICGNQQVVILNRWIERVEVVSASGQEVIFTLRRPPLFLAFHKANYLARLQALSPAHACIGQAVNRAVVVKFLNGYECSSFCMAGLGRVMPSTIQLGRRGLFSAAQMKLLKGFMKVLPFPVAFQIDVIVSDGLLVPNDILNLRNPIAELDRHRGLAHADKVLISFVDRLRRAKYHSAHHSPVKAQFKTPTHHFNDAVDYVASTQVSQPTPNTSSIRFAVVTPTGINLDGPVVDQSNATLRLHPQHQDLFLRVSFREEDHSTFKSLREWAVRDFLLKRYKPLFIRGLEVAGRGFHFLGWSSAGLKEQTALFVAPFNINGTWITAEWMRREMGNFAKCELIPARWMARIGQNFSTTKHALNLKPDQIEIIDDIAPPNSPWLFTDGVGTISLLVAHAILAALSPNPSEYDWQGPLSSTCFQVRIMGAKGMVSVDPTLTGFKVRLRRSMIKFDASGPSTLNIANEFDRPSPAYTNKPLIQILEGLGVPADAFCKLQQAAIGQTEAAKASWNGLAGLLETVNLGRSAKLAGVLGWLSSIVGEQASGTVKDEFRRQITNLAVIHSHRQLKFRARIPLPGCWTLVGIADEEPGGFLAENEIYACVHEKGKDPIYLEGWVTISRSPVIHPGDVRLVGAIGTVDPSLAPRIAFQKNCVVFPVKGTRPLPSMLGGGDLDGDPYQIITLPALRPNRVEEPGEYNAPVLVHLDEPSTVDDAAEFFLRFATSDRIGTVSRRHLMWADWSPAGIFSEECSRLAKQHSIATDYFKTGVEVCSTDLPIPPPERPDFISSEATVVQTGLPEPGTYPSPRALGVLFRRVGADLVRSNEVAAWNRDGRGLDSAVNSFAIDEELVDPSRAITCALAGYFRLPTPKLAVVVEMKCIMREFANRLQALARLCSATGRPLSEHELLLGTIASATEGGRAKKECVEQLIGSTGMLFGQVRSEIAGGAEGAERVARFWAAWEAAREAEGDEERGRWGAGVFGWVVLGGLMEALEGC